MESCWWVFKQLLENDKVYRAYQITPFSTALYTPLIHMGSKQNEKMTQDPAVEFDSLEALARALIEERFQRATLVEKLGALEADLSEKDSIVSSMEKEKSTLAEEIKASETIACPRHFGGPRLLNPDS